MFTRLKRWFIGAAMLVALVCIVPGEAKAAVYAYPICDPYWRFYAPACAPYPAAIPVTYPYAYQYAPWYPGYGYRYWYPRW